MKTKIPKDKKASKARPKATKKVAKSAPAVAKQKGFLEEIIALHNLKIPEGAHKRRKIKGRGSSSGHGKTSTRGSKGQTSRSGRATYPGFEGGQTPLIRRVPKRGFASRAKLEYQIVNLNELNRIKEENISLDLLKERGLIKDKDKLVKILGDGEIKNPVTIQTHAVSKNAAQKIKDAGGKVEILHV